MTFKHKIKMIFAKIRWRATHRKERKLFTQRYKNFDELRELHRETEEEFIKVQRARPTHSDTWILKGKIEILELLLYGDR